MTRKASTDRTGEAIEYTDLRKEATLRDVEMTCLEASICGLAAVVVPSALVRSAAGFVDRDGPSIGTVISYPFGTQSPSVKAREAAAAVAHGAHALDIVPHFGAVFAGRWDDVEAELTEVRDASASASLRLVLEAGRLSSEKIQEICSIAVRAGYEYVVNTVGFRIVSTDPDAEGAASAGVLESLRELAGGALKLKAAGGITTLEAVHELVAAGASRVAVPACLGLLRRAGWIGKGTVGAP
jgi:deoxyribose-phosphate aldolase